MKRKLFIGSSSEGLEVAGILKKAIEDKCGDWIECSIWNGGNIFQLNKSTLDCLMAAVMGYDYAILVATADDATLKKDEIHLSIRDNIIFELGLFTGGMGLSRCFGLFDEIVDIPSDLYGITRCMYNSENKDAKIQEIISNIERTKDEYNLRALPSSALALGYFNNFVVPVYKEKSINGFSLEIFIPVNISDIETMEKQYARKYACRQWKLFRVLDCSKRADRLHKYKNKKDSYFDFPNTLSTLYDLISNSIATDAIGGSTQKTEMLMHEIKNFKNALITLINRANYDKFIHIRDFIPE